MKKIIINPWIYLFLFVLVFFYKQIFLDQVFYCCDNLLINIPARILLARELTSGHFPLWNPYLLSGTPFLADINLALLYPLNLLYFFLPAFKAMTASVIVSVLIALAGMYILARSFNLSRLSAVTTSIIFGFSGTLVTYTNNIPMLQVAGLLPWVFWAVYKYVSSPSQKNLVLAAQLSTLQIFAGHPQLTYLTWLLIFGYLFCVTKLTKIILSFLFLGTLVFLLSAVQVLPFLELARFSSRTGFGYSYATFDSLNPANLIRLILPNIVGDLSRGTAWIQGGSIYGYVGAIAILLAFFAPFKNRLMKFFTALSLISLIAALGKYTPFYYLIYRLLPGAGSFRSPQHYLLIYTFSVSVLAGFGFEAARSQKIMNKITKVFFAASTSWLIFAVTLYILSLKVPQYFSLLPSKIIVKVQNPQIFKQIIFLVAENALVSAILLFVCALIFKKRRALVVAVIFVELYLFSSHGRLSVPMTKVNSWLATSQQTAELLKTKDNERFFVSRSLDAAPRLQQFGLSNYAEESAWQAKTLRTNLGMLYGLSSIDGYASMIYAPYSAYFNKIQVDPTGIDLRKINVSELSLLGVGRVEEGENQAIKFTGIETLGTVFLEKNGLKTGRGIVSQNLSPNRLSIQTSTSAPSDLVVMTTNYPGWQVSVDGKREILGSYKTIFQKVKVYPGKHVIEFNFRPKSVIVGITLSLWGFTIWLFLAVNEVINRRVLRGNLKPIKVRPVSK